MDIDLFLLIIGVVLLVFGGADLIIGQVFNKVALRQRKERYANKKTSIAKGTEKRRQVDVALRAIESRANASNSITLDQKLVQAGFTMNLKEFFIFRCAIGGILGFLSLIFLEYFFVSVLASLIGFYGVPNWVLMYKRRKRIGGFINELPSALDVIVRGVKTGLPLSDCIRVVSSDIKDPVKTEFIKIIEAQSMGLSLAEAFRALFLRVPSPEANFLSIVIEIQSKSGGGISEALGNLSRVIRERKNMRAKASALSMEAKSSAAIIAAMPFLVTGGMYASSPEIVSLLWTTNAGKITLVIAGLWMLLGILVMKKMINFDI